MKKFEEKTISTNLIFKGKLISLHVDDVKLINGKTSKREIVEHPGGVSVLAVTDDKKIILVEQYRKPLEKSTIEIPAGKHELEEDPIVTAKRELEEETGYTCNKLEYVTSFYTSPGFANELLYLYEAVFLHKKKEKLSLDEDEFLNVLEVPIEESIKMVHSGQIRDAKTIIAIQYWQLKNI